MQGPISAPTTNTDKPTEWNDIEDVITKTVDGVKTRLDTTTILNEGLLSGVEWAYCSTALSTTSVTDDTVTFTFKTAKSGGDTLAVVKFVYSEAQTLPFVEVERTT